MTDTLIADLIQAIKDNDGDIREAVYDLDGEFLERNLIEHGSWSLYYENIVRVKNRYFRIHDEDPATEMQEGQDDEELDIVEVDPHPVTKVEYRTTQGAKKISFYVND